jgi:hypothetical protein
MGTEKRQEVLDAIRNFAQTAREGADKATLLSAVVEVMTKANSAGLTREELRALQDEAHGQGTY